MTSTNTDGGVLTLIGDSILDNAVYVKGSGIPGSYSVTDWLKRKLEPKGWVIHLRAIDGDVIAGVPKQLDTVPKETTHLLLSIGGNDGLSELSTLRSRGLGPCSILSAVSGFKAKLAAEYSDLLDLIEKNHPGVHVLVMTLYHPPFPNTLHRWIAYLGTRAAGGAIKAEAAKRGLPVIDIATIFNEETDFANPIEPGVPGGDKITNNVVRCLETYDFGGKKYAEFNSTELSEEGQRYKEELVRLHFSPHRPLQMLSSDSTITQGEEGGGDEGGRRATNDEWRGGGR